MDTTQPVEPTQILPPPRPARSIHLRQITVKNFRLLQDVNIDLHERMTLIVGRNNSGKTSLMELFRRLLSDNEPSFRLEDFSLSTHDRYWMAFRHFTAGGDVDQAERELPRIEVVLKLTYDIGLNDLGGLSECIIDVNEGSNEAQIQIQFAPIPNKIAYLFEGTFDGPDENERRELFFKSIKARLPASYSAQIWAIDPNDSNNRRKLEWKHLRSIVKSDYIGAQRGLDDSTLKDRNLLGKILENLFNSASLDPADTQERQIVQQLELEVEKIQLELDKNFKTRLGNLLPAFKEFGYPGLNDPKLITETSLNAKQLLVDHTKVRYTGRNGVNLPEGYNGLGTRNLIYILLHLFGFFQTYKLCDIMAGVHLIFIEEPEAHLHPQMQEVFIKKIQDVADSFGRHLTDFLGWPVQFIISTHSAHIANAAHFESIRYFLAAPKNEYELRKTRIIDLRNLFSTQATNNAGEDQVNVSRNVDDSDESRNFIHQYMTLTRCDLFFADKAILIEGPAERILLPRMIEKIDLKLSEKQKLSCQYITVMEVGGDYAYHFFKLLDFLELPSLIITDIDAVTKNPIKNPKGRGAQTTAAPRYRACPVSEGQTTCNNSIKQWFKVSQIDLVTLRSMKDEEKTLAYRRLAYQIPEQCSSPCGRSFEDAFILANLDIFRNDASTEAEQVDDETFAWNYVNDDLKNGKTDFAIKYAIAKTEWIVPRYIADGLRWLATAPGQCDLNQVGTGDKSSLGDSDA